MKTIKKTLLLGLLVLLSLGAQSQTTFKIDSINIDSGFVNPTYCVGKSKPYISVPIALSGYSQGDSVEISIYYGDGTSDTKKFGVWAQGPSNWCTGYFDHMYNTPGQYNIFITALAPDLKTDSYLSKNKINAVPCGTISGNVYFDANNNCIKDVSEIPVRWTIVTVSNSVSQKVFYAYVDNAGNYSVDVPLTTSYNISVQSSQYPQFCPVTGYNNVSAPANAKNFGMTCNTSGFDLTGMVWGGFRPGFNRTVVVRPINLSCIPKSGRIRLILSDPRISYSYTPVGQTAPTISGDTLSWNFSNLDYTSNYYWNNSYWIKVMTDTSASIGDTICIPMIVEPIAGDNNPANNMKTFCLPVNNSVDPNDKIGLPVGFGPDKIIERGQDLEYTIRFQNTGNDTAYKVVLLDTLPEELDLESLVINGASHLFNFYLVDERVLKFEFLDINLPDSTTNEELSHGSINFSIGQKANLPYGTEIENTAHIYFDFNDAVITNTDHHRVDLIAGIVRHEQRDGLSVNIYPNPGKDKIWIDINSDEMVNVTLYNVLGKSVSTYRYNTGTHAIDVNQLVNGVYLVEVKSDTQRITEKLIIQK